MQTFSTLGGISLILTSISALSIAATSPSYAYTIFQAQEDSSIPFAAGTAAENSFVNALSAPVLVDSLNGLTPGGLTGQTIFGGLGTLSQPITSFMFIDTDGQCYGSSQCIQGFPDVNPAFGISFSTPVQGFGFWANDQNTVGDQITILVNGGPFTLGPSATNSLASFYGFVADNPSEYISTLAFNSSNPSRGYLTFDQFTTAVPGPLPLAGAAAAFGFSRKLRHRIKTSRMA